MSAGPLYKIKHFSGRILGPLDGERIRRLVLKNQVNGTEIVRLYPEGDWKDINTFPELAGLLIQHAEGKLHHTTASLKSAHSSYRPILAETEVLPAMPPSPVIAIPIVAKDPPKDVPIVPPKFRPPPVSPSMPSASAPANLKLTDDDQTRRVDAADDELSRTVLTGEERTVLVETEDDLVVYSLGNDPESLDLNEALRSDPELAGGTVPRARKAFTGGVNSKDSLSQEPTVRIERVKFLGRQWRKLKWKEAVRILLIAAALGYFGYESFLKEDENQASVFRRPKTFRPTLPDTQPKKVDPALSQRLYVEAMKVYVLDHPAGYMAAAQRLLQSVNVDPENVKAIAMLASAYINLIDSSNKDDNFFGVISKLIEMAKAKNISLPETTIAEVEFLVMTRRPAAGLETLVNYTKQNPSFDKVIHYYAAYAFFSKGDYQNASTQLNQIADNKAFSAKVFYLKGRTAEMLGDGNQAKLEYEKALRVYPQHMLSLLRLVAMSAAQGRTLEMQPQVAMLIKHSDLLAPQSLAEAYFLQSKVYQLKENWEAALFSLDRAVNLDPRNSVYLVEFYTLKAAQGGRNPQAQAEARMYFFLGEGEKLLNRGAYQEALLQFLQAKDANPGSLYPYLRMGEMFTKMNDMVNARVNLKRAAELAPNSVQVWSKYIHVLIQNYEWDEAQKAMEKFRALPVGQSAIDKLAGDFYAKQNRYSEAQTFYKKAMMRESIDPDVYIAFARSLMATRNYRDAPFFFALAQRFDPQSSDAVVGIAKATAQTEGLDAGVRILQDELQRSGSPRAEYLAGIAELLIQKGEWKAAQTYIDDARRVNPDYALPWKLQAQVYLNDEHVDKKALDKALDAFKSYSDRNTSDPSGYFERYLIYSRRAKFDEARDELDRIFAIYPKYPNLHYHRGVVYSTMGNHKAAVEEYQSEIANNPENPDALTALGRALASLGDARGAITHLSKAMQLAPKNSAAKFEAANANRAMRNYSGAIALYQAAAKLDPGNALIQRRMGDTYREMGDSTNARAAFKRYLQMEPDAVDRSEIEPFL